MIGLIGPQDSVDLVLAVAREMRLQHALVPGVYAEPRQAPSIAARLGEYCQVLLYTGRMPHMLTNAAGAGKGRRSGPRVDFIPHGGADLYRTIGALLLLPAFRASFPSLSIDSIEADNVKEAFGELGLGKPPHVIALSSNGEIDLDGIVREHIRLFRSGEVQFCLTCIGYVYEALARARVPAMRIVHSRLVIRESLAKVWLALELSRAEASQVAACVIGRHKAAPRAGRVKSPERKLLAAARECAAAIDGRVVQRSPHEVVVLTTRGVAERALRAGVLARIGERLGEGLSLGVGYGPSASIAEDLGRRAAQSSGAAKQPLHVASADQAKELRAGNLRAARSLKLSPTIARRLIEVFGALDPASFTAAELAAAYRVNPSSARRLIRLLREQRLVDRCGIEKRDGAGRPTTSYRIALSRLARAIR